MPEVTSTRTCCSRSFSISGNTAVSSPTLAPCSQTSGPSGRLQRRIAVPFAEPLFEFLAAAQAALQPKRSKRRCHRHGAPIGAQGHGQTFSHGARTSRLAVGDRVSAFGRLIQRGLERDPRGFEVRIACIGSDPNGIADHAGDPAERQIDGAAIPVVEHLAAARGQRDRIDRAAGIASEPDDARPRHARYLRHVGGQCHVVALGKRLQHLEIGADPALAMEAVAMIARAADRLNSQPFRRDRVHFAVAMAGNQRLALVALPLDEGRHEVLTMPHRDDDRQVRVRRVRRYRRAR